MRKGRDGEKNGKNGKKRKKKIWMKIVATTSLPAVYRPNGYARTTTAGTPHARANIEFLSEWVVRVYKVIFISNPTTVEAVLRLS